MTSIDIAENGNLRIHVPMKLKRKAGRKLVLAPEALDGAVPDATGPVQNSMVDAIAKAYEWAAMLESGEVENVSVLARQVKLCRPYVMRILSLVNLAPDIVEAIVYGKEPDGLSLARIFEGFPDDWEEQRKVFGR